MSERDSGFSPIQASPEGVAPPASAPGTPPPATASAGAMLRQLREAAGVDPALVASAMKVSMQKLDALENDRFDELPDLTFARGLASAIARAFGADPAPILERMPLAAPGLRAQSTTTGNPPFRRAGDAPTPMIQAGLPKPLLIVVALLLLGALALWLLPTLPIQLTAPAASAPHAAEVSEPVAATPASEPVAPAEMSASAASVASAEPVAPAASAPAAAASSAEAGASDLLAFTASGETWLTVRDASGKQLVNRTLASGETLKLGGQAPLSVTVGRKEAVTVTVRGKPFDHRSLSRTSVSRFTVE